MPTTRPRYTVTDTGEVSEMLDLAGRAWPDIADRRLLLLRLAAVGHESLRQRLHDDDRVRRRSDQLAAMRRASGLVDTELLLSDTAWQ